MKLARLLGKECTSISFVIVDSNIIFSALIKNGPTRKLLFELDETLCIPKRAVFELEKHVSVIQKKSGLERKEFEIIVERILSLIQTIPSKRVSPFFEQAAQIMKSIDPEDSAFIACALATPNSIIWSDDKHFQQQSVVPVITTKEMLGLRDSEQFTQAK